MKSYSQAGQDIWVRRIFGENRPRTFLDIGCAGEQYSNTLALEQEGWTGTLVDMDPNAAQGRKNPFVCGDATTMDFRVLPPFVDYLSLDVDFETLNALKNLPMLTTRFQLITIEHDAYRFGDRLRIGERELLTNLGYKLVCADVCNPVPFEDWWCSLALWGKAREYLSSNKQWTEILR